jgi:hypothetical protein
MYPRGINPCAPSTYLLSRRPDASSLAAALCARLVLCIFSLIIYFTPIQNTRAQFVALQHRCMVARTTYET